MFHVNVTLGENENYITNWKEYREYLQSLIRAEQFEMQDINSIEYVMPLSDSNSNVYLGFCNASFCVVKVRHFLDKDVPIYVAKEIHACLNKTSRACMGIKLTETSVYFVFEYIPNTLSTLLNMDLQLPNGLYMHLCLGILKAVGGLHSNGFAHRDIKIENFCVRVDGEVVLIDMDSIGMLKNVSTIVPICTIKTRAPEVVLSGTYMNEKLDAWSTGMTMLRVCTHELFNDLDDFKTNEALLCKLDMILKNVKDENSMLCNILKKREMYEFAVKSIFPLLVKDPQLRKMVSEIM